jgi:NAD+--asparagine ADP-ribosyltransferase
VLDRESMASAIDALWNSAQLKGGDRVRSLQGSLRGVIVRILDDGQVVVRSDASGAERTCLPEALLPE